MKHLLIALATLLVGVFAQADEARLQQLLEQTVDYQSNEAQLDKARQAAFRNDLAEQQRLLKQAKAALAAERQRADALKQAFDNNEVALTEKEEALRMQVGNLGEMFGVVRQVANDLQTVLDDSLTKVEVPQRRADLATLAEAKELPDLQQLQNLWHTLLQEMTINGQISAFNTEVIGVDGKPVARDVVRIGTFNALSSDGYLAYDSELQQLRELGRQPAVAEQAASYLASSQAIAPLALDPSRGALLTMTLDSPDLAERIEQGAEVGYIILAVGVVGLLLAVWRLLVLLSVGSKLARQQKQLDQPRDDNPLGRILAVHQNLPRNIDSEVLEARMDEAVLRELPALERGQSIIKLFAGIAPLLGLLGTVTGMIATFQAITNFGTGDPKLMAAGISQALITTVLGLIVAIPLLLAHNWVASRSKALIQVLDEQSAGLMAEVLERQGRG
ncbi:biopolymer transporter ExbB [Bacterioplanes sanyensis]|uniref:MotA/TolQ/ExbB proton channel family protein n=1 Tax=Bacterioplanes sanyensis TaxID=1249553 RepID=UPI001675F33F|nr:MotA/TolQ/ExbB proton channel family protein [Bacterioplanes sanyensis]GGY42015.1 biopolymer transporter ExbB [Bacterioplanes sanyensis]